MKSAPVMTKSERAGDAGVDRVDSAGKPPACECCGKTLVHPFARKRGYSLWRCDSCGLAFVWPQPSTAQLKSLYSKEKGYFATANLDLAKLEPAANHWLHELVSEVGVSSGGRSFLDVGCATGQLMYHMRAFGWEVRGFDVNADAVKVAVDNGLDAKVATIEEYDAPAESVDVANLGDLIEHVPSPAAVLRKVHRLLKPGGLVVIRTPNNQCGYARATAILSRCTRLPWGHSEAPYHLYEFSPQSLSVLLERLGFEVARTQCAGRSRFVYRLGAYGAFDSLKAAMKTTGGYRFSPKLFFSLPKLLAVGSVLAPCYLVGRWLNRVAGSGDSLLIVARKRPEKAASRTGSGSCG